jgi:hypothetical protein
MRDSMGVAVVSHCEHPMGFFIVVVRKTVLYSENRPSLDEFLV